MRNVGCCMLLLLVFSCPGGVSRAAGPQFLHGEILEVDDAAREVLVRTAMEEKRSRLVRVVLPPALLASSPAGTLREPGCLAPGNHVRIRGNPPANGSGPFVAEEIRSCGMASCGDPTGVRSRLSRNRGNSVNGGMCQYCVTK